MAFYKNERHFGSDATALMGRKPELSIAKIFRMIGRAPTHPAVSALKTQHFPYSIYANESTGHTSIAVDAEAYTAEELLAMVLQNVKDMTNAFGGKGIKDCVITVPASFTQHEREAVYSAADIADLKILSLIEENTAAALHYAIDRTFEQPTVVLYYNMGAGSTQVSVVNYTSSVVKDGSKNKTSTQFEVLGKAWEDMGGFDFDLQLTELLAARFNEQWIKKTKKPSNDIRAHFRPMTRLRIEANKVKEILSANAEYPVRAEQLHADVDLVTKVTRGDFEASAAHLFERITKPIDRALAMAGLTLADISAVELLGGGVRMPKVKRMLDEHFQQVPVGQHLNGDEAMALGASFRAANLSTAFRVRKVGMTDLSVFGVSLRLDALHTTEEAQVWHKHTSLYSAKSPLPSKMKTVAFHHSEDIRCAVEYDSIPEGTLGLPEGTNPLLAVYNITGISAFAGEHKDRGVAPKVHLSFGLDASGIVSLTKAEATLEYEEEVPVPVNATDVNTTEEVAPVMEKKKHVLRRVLTVARNLQAVLPTQWSSAEISEAKTRLKVLQAADELRKAKAAAMNDLEAYVYKVKNRLTDDESALAAVSTELQRQDVMDLANAAEEWLYDDGRDQTVAVYAKKQAEVKAAAEAIFRRFSEVKARKEAVAAASKSLSEVRKQVGSWAEKMPHISDEEKDALLALVQVAEQWIADKTAAQDKASPFDKPVFDSLEVTPQLKPVAAMVEKLMRKPKPAPPVIPMDKNTTSSSNSTEGAAEEVRVEREPDAATAGKGEEEKVAEEDDEEVPKQRDADEL